MQPLLERFKPAARARTHLLLAAGLWTLVGSGLFLAGAIWCLDSPLPWSLSSLVAGVLIGAAKARWILAPVAARSGARIAARGDGRCLGGFVSWGTWLLIAAMMSGGYLLRHSGVPLPLLGLLYTAVGSALVLASTLLWRARAARGEAPPPA